MKKGGMGDVERESEGRRKVGREEGREGRLRVKFLSLGIEWPHFKTEDEDILAKETKELLEKQRERIILTAWFLIKQRIIVKAWLIILLSASLILEGT